MNNAVRDLIINYRNLHKDVMPDWAVHKNSNSSELVIPTVPFVGEKYFKQNTKILVYASTENLSSYHNGNWKIDLDNDSIAENRHRYCFDNEELQIAEKLPFVHCTPLNSGALLAAVMYIAYRLRGEISNVPEFYETIAFANYGKYSRESKNNLDYANKSEFLRASQRFVKEDVLALRPDIIIMPDIKDDFIDAFVKDMGVTVIRTYQMNATVINCTLKRKSEFSGFDEETLPAEIKFVVDNIKGINKENYLYIFKYLDSVLEML